MATNVKVVRRKEANGEFESSDSLIRRFKKAVQKADLMKEIKRREYFLNNAEKRRRKSEEHRKTLKKKKH